ncbi:hypothetical protein [Halorussus sp. MSC15.2]|uniref:DUF7524 family protein n=1 Tax=Halorussus sp. MSC15.2 TaxID=2283638 RepID=UPI0013D7EC5F|nr:hypothetical protein [Halorussus sp. MSC15.2]NEU56918.1 hypothetical protein [Halorussus sp. MSC15.2]
MPDSLPVRLNDDRLHDIQTRASFEATDSFPILLHNGDAPVHVHLHLDDALSSVASIPANNHFVDANSTQQVNVEVGDGPRPVEGQVKIVTGHGAETDYVTVSIVESEEGEDAVDIDETLAAPVRDEGDEDADEGYELSDLSLGRNAPVAVLGVLAITVAVGSATLSDSVAVLVGALAVLGSVVAAGYLLLRSGER